jgi:hypothetical protein
MVGWCRGVVRRGRGVGCYRGNIRRLVGCCRGDIGWLIGRVALGSSRRQGGQADKPKRGLKIYILIIMSFLNVVSAFVVFCRTIALCPVCDPFMLFLFQILLRVNFFKIQSSTIGTKYSLVTSTVNVVIAYRGVRGYDPQLTSFCNIDSECRLSTTIFCFFP